MEIPLIYVLIGAELLLIFLGLTITFGIMLLRRPVEQVVVEDETESKTEEEAVEFAQTSYIDYLQQAMERNSVKLKQQQRIESEIAAENDSESAEQDVIELDEAADNIDETAETAEQSPPPDEAQSVLLQVRDEFLQMEQASAEKTEHEIHFWDSIYEGMQTLVDKLKTLEIITQQSTETEVVVEGKAAKEKVFYIETQGKKIDSEVNRLKDIIFEQENALNSMKGALANGGEQFSSDEETIAFLQEQIEIVERQLSDARMCMEVLEMENNRLQEEIGQLEGMVAMSTQSGEAAGSSEEIEQMKQNLAQQESRIQQLQDTIESLELEASQAEKLKQTLNDFTRSSQEMMNCITILEEENERLQEEAGGEDEAPPAAGADTEELKAKISSLEEEIIKKDVAYAQLQDEFSSMETEYLAMYEAMHGDGSS